MTSATQVDVLVVGDGLTGLAMAVSLLTHPVTRALSVGLLSTKPPLPTLAAEWDLRVYAVAKPLEQLLHDSDAWRGMSHRVSQRIDAMVIWDQADRWDSHKALKFSAAEAGVAQLGWMLEQADMRQSLWVSAQRLGCRMLVGEATTLKWHEREVSVATPTQVYRADLVIAADGQPSTLREQAGIAWQSEPYEQSAIVAHFTPQHPHQQTAWQRFCDTGPLALLPLSHGQVSCVYSLPTALADTWMAATDAAFAAEVSRASAGVLGELRVVSPRAQFALVRAAAKRYCAERLALIGDAAHRVHPLAGQGLNQGILDVVGLTQQLAAAIQRGQSVGEAKVLQAYSRARSTQAALMGGAIDGIYHWFQTRSAWADLSRRYGFALLNHLPHLRAKLAKQAMGYG